MRIEALSYYEAAQERLVEADILYQSRRFGKALASPFQKA